MLKDSTEVVRWMEYAKSNKGIVDGLIQNGMMEYLDPPEASPIGPYVRTHKKIGPNEKCPCGSGKKFKKCCRGKGKYD